MTDNARGAARTFGAATVRDAASTHAVMRAWNGLQRHWLLGVNVCVVVFVGLPLLAPALMAYGFTDAANTIYTAYHAVCHQWAFRSFFLFGPQWTYAASDLEVLGGPGAAYTLVGSPTLGYKVAFCERDLAIYLAVLAAGLVYAVRRGRTDGLSLVSYALLILPMALDGVSQLLGWRESSAELRILTGALFGAASVWLIYPRVDDTPTTAAGRASQVLVPEASRL
ncbi:MAG: DUF2085 domain-containing protein [Chloroflexi bacterium]|nr:DUF2085 domain-containing protein [Chloroflexota bacterium]